MLNIRQDHMKHYIAGNLIAACAIVLTSIAPFDFGVMFPLSASLAAVTVAGIGREVYNHYFGGNVELSDVIWTLAGWPTVAAVWLVTINPWGC